MKVLIAIGVLTIAAALGSKRLCAYVKHHQTELKELKYDSNRWQDLYYEKLTQDDIAWG